MTDTYTQLLNSYAHDLQWRLKKSEQETIDQLIQIIPMSNENKVDLADHIAHLWTCCCTESFALGIQIGLRLTQDIGSFSPTAS